MRAILPLLFFINLLAIACAGNQEMFQGRMEFEDAEPVAVPGDILHLTLRHYPNFNQTMIVQSDGTIDVGGLGKLRVEDRTVAEIKREMQKHFSGVLALPELDLTLQESLDLSFYITGAIVKPGKIQYRKNISIEQGISLAGGLKDTEQEYEVVIFRKTLENGVQMYKVKLSVNGKPIDSGFKLHPYDMIIVLRAMAAKKKELII